MKAINIKWDVDNKKDLNYLPKEMEVPNGMIDEEEISDYITNETGFCHNGFELVGIENKKMKTLNVTMICKSVYNSSIEVPKEMILEEAIEYAKEHINEIPLGEMEYISDSDELDEENCDFDEE